MIEVALRHRLGDFTLDAHFAAGPGVTALFGPSGAGKTSIVQAVAGLLNPQQGRIVFGGRIVLDTQAGIAVPPQQRRAALVFQDARLFPHLSVENNLLYGWRRAPVKSDGAAIAQTIALLGLETLLRRKPRHLSGGEKSRVALGRALLSAPDILLLDEPLAGLDAPRRDEILGLLERLRETARIPILYVSHSVDEVARLADQVVLLEGGRVTASGRPADLLLSGGGLGAVLDAVALGPRAGLTALAFDGGEMLIAAAAPAGARLRLRIAAQDILIAREEPRAISANNILAATVTGLMPQGALCDVALACGAANLVARITQASAARLALTPGLTVYAIIKSVTVDRAQT